MSDTTAYSVNTAYMDGLSSLWAAPVGSAEGWAYWKGAVFAQFGLPRPPIS